MFANIVFAAILLSLVIYILLPFVRPPSVQMETSAGEQGYAVKLQRRKESYVRALRAIKDIDFEYASAKMSAQDYQKLKKHYNLKAAECLKELEEIENEKEEKGIT